MLRFFLTFLAIQAALFTAELTPPVQRVLIQPFTAGLAKVTGLILEAFGRDTVTTGAIIRDVSTQFAVEIAAGCNGVEAMIILVAAILAFPAPWRYRLWGMVIGVLTIQVLNLVRIISLIFLGMWNQAAFEWAHLYVWQALIILDALLVWLIWLRSLPRSHDSPSPL